MKLYWWSFGEEVAGASSLLNPQNKAKKQLHRLASTAKLFYHIERRTKSSAEGFFFSGEDVFTFLLVRFGKSSVKHRGGSQLSRGQ